LSAAGRLAYAVRTVSLRELAFLVDLAPGRPRP